MLLENTEYLREELREIERRITEMKLFITRGDYQRMDITQKFHFDRQLDAMNTYKTSVSSRIDYDKYMRNRNVK